MPDDSAPLTRDADAFDLDGVHAALAGTPYARVRYVAQTGSTNDDAAALLGQAASAGTTIVAGTQTAGRGRKPGRTWIAPAGSGLLFTTILPEPVATAALWSVPFWVALAVADGVEAACGVRLDLRWPNDLDLGGRKAAGILCLSRVGGALAEVACGVGINVRRLGAAAVDPPPAYLSDVAAAVTREAVLAGVLRAFGGIGALLAEPETIGRAWERRAGLAGRRYRLRLDADGTLLEGTAVRLDPEGGLVVRTAEGERVARLADARVVDAT